MIIRDIIFSTNPPATPYVLWIKAGANNINTIHIYDGGWRKIGTSSGGGTSDYTDLENKPKINNVVLDGNLSLEDLGIVIPSLENYVTKEALNTALSDYAKKADIPSVEGLLSEIKAQELYQPKGDYALKSELPDIKDLATKTEVTDAISNQKFKTINNQKITGEGNIEIQGGGSSVTVDDALSTESINPVQNKVITQSINQINTEIGEKQPKGDYALKTDIPDTSGFITEAQVDTKLESYAPKGDYALKTEIPTNVSDLVNDAGFQTAEDITSATKDLATKTELNGKQDTLVSGTNIKTINGNPILGEGNIEIQGGSTVTVDDALNVESVNPVQNKVITEKINAMNELLAQLDEKVFPTTLSVSGGGTYDEGTSQTVMVSWKLMKNGQTLTPDSVTVNGETVDPATSYKVFTDVTTTTTYRVAVVYKGKTYNGSTTATFKVTYYRYYGAAPLNTDFNNLPDEVVTGFTKEVATSKEAYNVAITIPVEGICTYIYPKRFGTLTQVQDVNAGGAAADNWVISTPSTTPEPVATKVIGGEECYIYRSTQPNYEDTFKFNFK